MRPLSPEKFLSGTYSDSFPASFSASSARLRSLSASRSAAERASAAAFSCLSRKLAASSPSASRDSLSRPRCSSSSSHGCGWSREPQTGQGLPGRSCSFARKPACVFRKILLAFSYSACFRSYASLAWPKRRAAFSAASLWETVFCCRAFTVSRSAAISSALLFFVFQCTRRA